MSQAAVKRHEYDEHQEAELAKWPGVEWSRQVRGKHYALVLSFNGRSRFVIYPTSPGDSIRGMLNHLTDVRATLRFIGAERLEEQVSAKPRRQRNRTEPIRVVIADRATGGPKRDPWTGLAGWTPPPKPPRRVSLLRRLYGWRAI